MPQARNLVTAGFSVAGLGALNGTVRNNATATGSTQATAVVINDDVTTFSTVAASTGAVLPPTSHPSDEFWVRNAGANPLSVYPPLGGNINGLGVNAALAVPAGKVAHIRCFDTNRNFVAVVSA